MAEYTNKEALINEIRKTADVFIEEFHDIDEADKDLRLEGVDRTPQEIIAYQLGWMGLVRGWDQDEKAGKEVVTPAPGYKWNQLGALYQSFSEKYKECSLVEMREDFTKTVDSLLTWLNDDFTEEQVFQPAGRKWAASTPANWPVYKWIHINTAAPFKTFRSKIRKWKKIRAAQ